MTEDIEPERGGGDDPSVLDLRRYLQIVRKRLWIIAAILAVGVTAMVLYTSRLPKVYQATASVVIDPQPPQVFGKDLQEVVTLGTGSYWSNQEYYNTQVDILTNYDLIRQTVIRNELYLNPKLMPPVDGDTRSKDELIDAATSILTGAITAQQNRDSRVVKVSVRHTDRQLAIDLANKHIQTYLDYTLGLRTHGTSQASQFLAKELDTAEARLRESEKKLYDFKKENDIISVSLEDKQNLIAADLARYTSALADARIKRIELGSVRDRAKKLTGEDVLESPIFALTETTAVADSLKTEYTVEKRKLAELGEDLGPKHPGYLSQQNKVDELLTTIQREAQRAMREVDERYLAIKNSEEQFKAEVERLRREALDLAPKTVEYARLQRKAKSDEDNYDLVLGRLRSADISGRNKEINVHHNSRARSAVLVYPRMRFNVAIAVLLSLMLGVGVAFLLDFLDRTIKTAEDVEAALGAPLLGIIPVVEHGSGPDPVAAQREQDLYVFSNPKSRPAECCRSIRTNILFSSADRPAKTITISSAQPREGKTTTTIYLGTTMAQSGLKVLLVDSDMRRPRLHKALGVSRNIGLTTLILGEASIDDVVKTTDIPNLYVLPCGPQPPNPAELLLTNRFQEVLRDLSERFDHVLLDSPPLLAVTDGVVLAKLSDGVVVVTHAGKTLTEDGKQSARQLRDVDASILGVILNDLDVSDRRYGYGYYRYYHGYGYGEDAAEATSSKA